MKLDKLTMLVFLGLFAALMIFDVWTLLARGYETTVSWTLYVWGTQFPIVPFAFGVLVGHLLWPNRAGATPKGADVLDFKGRRK
jgi:hypothetical protein